jgi:hypothetical protein
MPQKTTFFIVTALEISNLSLKVFFELSHTPLLIVQVMSCACVWSYKAWHRYVHLLILLI